MRLLPLLLVLLAWGMAQAQTTYRWIDPKSGQTVFSDQPPPPGAKQVNKHQAGNAAEDPNAGLPFTTRKAAENFPVVLYTSADCGDACRQGRALLNSRGVPFKEQSVATKADAEALMRLAGGEVFVPFLTVGKQTAKGFLADAWNSLLDLAGYPKTAPYGFKPRAAPEQ